MSSTRAPAVWENKDAAEACGRSGRCIDLRKMGDRITGRHSVASFPSFMACRQVLFVYGTL